MKISIITPTIQRDSLRICCESVDRQSHTNWEHIVFIDAVEESRDLIKPMIREGRFFVCNRERYGNFGNTPRHLAWDFTTGDYLIYLDDDNFLADPDALNRLAFALKERPKFAIVPCVRFGWYFFNYPPGVCRTDSANLVIQREIGRWPKRDEYTLDGIFAEELHAKYGSVPLEIMPVTVVPSQGKGE